MTNNAFLVQTLALQNRGIQLKRSRLRLESRRVSTLEKIAATQERQTAALETIASELVSLRFVYSALSGVEVMPTSCGNGEE